MRRQPYLHAAGQYVRRRKLNRVSTVLIPCLIAFQKLYRPNPLRTYAFTAPDRVVVINGLRDALKVAAQRRRIGTHALPQPEVRATSGKFDGLDVTHVLDC